MSASGSITIEEDFAAPSGGWALVRVGSTDQRLKTGALRIRRLLAEPECLGPDGWQAVPGTLSPARIVHDPAETVLTLGPAICRHLREDTHVEIVLEETGLAVRLAWPYVTPPPAGPMPARVFTEAKPEPRSEPTIGSADDIAKEPSRSVETMLDGELSDVEMRADDWSEAAWSAERDERGSRTYATPWLIAAAILLVLLPLGAVLVLGEYWSEEEPVVAAADPVPENATIEDPASEDLTSEDSTPVEPAGDEAIAESASPATAESEQAAEQGGDASATVDPIAALRACATEECAPPDLFALGETLRASGEGDLGYRAIDQAAQRGHGPALRQMALWLDPSRPEQSADGMVPDAVRAARYYRRAEAAGDAEAADALSAMCDVQRRPERLAEIATAREPTALEPTGLEPTARALAPNEETQTDAPRSAASVLAAVAELSAALKAACSRAP